MDDQPTRMRNAHNRNQGPWKRVLTVCSAGLLRSPTIAHVLSQPPYNCNCRPCGSEPRYALIQLDPVLCEWADAIVIANIEQLQPVAKILADLNQSHKPVFCLNIPDNFNTRERRLVDAVEAALKSVQFKGTDPLLLTGRFDNTGTH